MSPAVLDSVDEPLDEERDVGALLLKVSVDVMTIVDGGCPGSVGVWMMMDVMVEGARVDVVDDVVGVIAVEVVLEVVGGDWDDDVVGGTNEEVDTVVGGVKVVGSVVGSVVGTGDGDGVLAGGLVEGVGVGTGVSKVRGVLVELDMLTVLSGTFQPPVGLPSQQM